MLMLMLMVKKRAESKVLEKKKAARLALDCDPDREVSIRAAIRT